MELFKTQERPSVEEAMKEIFISRDSHWTALLSTVGMTRISRSVVQRVWEWEEYMGCPSLTSP